MTKRELLDAIKDMPDDCEIVRSDGTNWLTPTVVDCDNVCIYLEDEEVWRR
ncbi:hypothetical protein SAMN05444162_0140 [Paenibacillaceae bacterium GAS479]|nr:hypothetical protein SAMN05444162_0140 [Paenibacillaceae bacterium GAS479]